MAKLGEIIATVKDIVRRPDMDAMVELRCIAALTAIHSEAEFPKDRIELVADVTVPDNIGQVTTDNDGYRLLNNFRVLESVWALDAEGNRLVQLQLHSPGEIAKLKMLNKDTNTCYIVGNGQLSFKCSVKVYQVLLIGYQVTPLPSQLTNLDGSRKALVDIQNITTWVTRNYETAVIDYAVGYIEGLKGNQELAKIHLDMYTQVHRPQLLNQASGYAGI
jgi:hypothetical protein